ncbi:MAG: DUF3567 family protein [Rhodocyclaceae bacterium]|nr:DUF3567 family protein [Rhodocyclaceae bacterium]MCB1962216.1 DUF3567 family protein [Rhodocyclaceae bacterium]
MQVVCNNPVLYVVDFPGFDAIEVIDKRLGRGTVFRDAAARRFRAELAELAASEEMGDFDELIVHYQSLLNQPAIYH